MKRTQAKLKRSDIIALCAVSFMAGFTLAFSMVSRSSSRLIDAERARSAQAQEFMAAAKSPDIWDELLGQGKR